MESKTWYLPQNKIEKEIEIRSHFGWEFLAKSSSSLTMKRERITNYKRLKSLEQQYDALTKKAPVTGIVFVGIGLIALLIALIFAKETNLKWAMFLVGGVMGLIGLGFIFAFLAVLPYRKKMVKEIFDNADQLMGKRKVLPSEVNMRKPGPHSYHIKKAVYDGELDIRY